MNGYYLGMDWIQWLILILGALTQFGVTGKSKAGRFFGFSIGILAQPLWFWTAYQNNQWGIIWMDVVYTVAYIRGCWNNKRGEAIC